jgi:hypothetical protein
MFFASVPALASPVFPCQMAADTVIEFSIELTPDLERSKNRHPRVTGAGLAATGFGVQIDAATPAKSAAPFSAQWTRRQRKDDLFHHQRR